MITEITRMHAEDAVAAANDFMSTERGTVLDGDFASQQLTERVLSVEERATALLTAKPLNNGMFMPLSKANLDSFDEAVFTLPGYIVLVPSAMVDRAANPALYPAVVSEDGLKTGTLRLHVHKQPYRQNMLYGTSIALSGAGQAETAGIGDHGRTGSDGVEAEHFATLLVAGGNEAVAADWQDGVHVNHAWRSHETTSVTSKMSEQLLAGTIDQETITVTKQQLAADQAIIFWHDGLQDKESGQIETATRDHALIIIQGLGFEAVKTSRPEGLANVQRLMSI